MITLPLPEIEAIGVLDVGVMTAVALEDTSVLDSGVVTANPLEETGMLDFDVGAADPLPEVKFGVAFDVVSVPLRTGVLLLGIVTLPEPAGLVDFELLEEPEYEELGVVLSIGVMVLVLVLSTVPELVFGVLLGAVPELAGLVLLVGAMLGTGVILLAVFGAPEPFEDTTGEVDLEAVPVLGSVLVDLESEPLEGTDEGAVLRAEDGELFSIDDETLLPVEMGELLSIDEEPLSRVEIDELFGIDEETLRAVEARELFDSDDGTVLPVENGELFGTDDETLLPVETGELLSTEDKMLLKAVPCKVPLLDGAPDGLLACLEGVVEVGEVTVDGLEVLLEVDIACELEGFFEGVVSELESLLEAVIVPELDALLKIAA